MWLLRTTMRRVFCALFLFLGFIQCNDAQLCNLLDSWASNITETCLKQLHTVCTHGDLAWKMFDASSKFLISGMTYSNVIDYGNFPECMSIDFEDQDGRILGKFCGLSTLIVNILLTPQTENILRSFGRKAASVPTISKDTFSQLRDIFLPDIPYVISKYSQCIPDACTPREVGYYFLYGHLDAFSLIVYTDLPCETVNSNTDYEAGDIVVIVFFGIIALLIIAGTIYDALCQNFKKQPYHPLLLSFSVLYNGKKLLQISDNTTEQIQCFNGMRFISIMWILAYHGWVVFDQGLVSLENYPQVQQWSNNISNRYVLSGLLAVDTFFFIAGFLLAFSYLKTATEESFLGQIKKVPKMYLHRYLRLTPAVGAMFLVTITIFRFLGQGPTWTYITNLLKNACKDKWWKFFLYIQNYTDPDTMCVNPTWYLSADMQMFILAPLVLIPTALFIKKKFREVILGLAGLTVLSVVVPMLIRYYVDEAAGNTYTTHERFNNFLIGITFGATMRMYKHKPFIFKPIYNVMLWIFILIVGIFFNLYWFDVDSKGDFDLLKYTLFYGFYRPVWCLSLVFMVYSCYHNQGGIIQWILTRPAFQILGRLTYSMYVIHFLVEVYAGGTLRTTTYFSNYFMFYNWCGHIIVTMILSVIWVLAFEFPMLTIDKYLLGDERKATAKRENQKHQ